MKKQVKLVSTQDGAALVEYIDADGVLTRKTVPVECVIGNTVDPEMLEMGITYGADWSKLVEHLVTIEGVEAELHRAGIWTSTDFIAKSALARAALSRVIVVPLLAALINYSREA